MDWIEDTLRRFGHQLGIDDLQAGPAGDLLLQLEDGSQIGIEHGECLGQDEMLVYVLVPVGYQAGSRVRYALARCHATSQARWSPQVGLRGSGPDAALLVLLRAPARGFTAPVLGDAVDHLLAWMEAIRHAA